MAEPTRKADVYSPVAKRFLWVDRPQSVNRLIVRLAILCAVLLLLDFVIHRHSYFQFEAWYGFYGFTGFIAFSLIVIAAKNLRRVIGRGEDYYAPYTVDAEPYPDRDVDIIERTHKS